MLSPFISQKLKFWALLSMLCLVFVHGYNLNNRYLQPGNTVEEPLTFTTYIQYFLSNGIFRFRIPMLFVISGYLLALKFPSTTYKKLVAKRFTTVFLPYLIWAVIGFLFTYLLTLNPHTNNLVVESGMMWATEDMQHINQYSWWMVLIRLTLYPFGYHLWFLRTLFILVLAYPAIQWLVTKRIYKNIFFILIGLMWLLEMEILPIGNESLLFFGLGIFIAKTNYDIVTPKKWMKPALWGVLFVLSAAIKTYLAFYVTTRLGTLPMILLHKLCVFSGLVFAWYNSDNLVRWAYNKNWFNALVPYTFIIYVAHVPLITYAIVWALKYTNHLPYYRLLNYVFLNIAVILICILIGWMIKTISPKLYSLLTGGRGIG